MQVLQADFLRTWSQVRGDLPAKTPHDCLTVHCLSRLLLLELHPDVQECPLSVLKPLLLRGVCSDPGTPLYLALRPVFHHLCEILTLFCYLYQRGYQRGTLPQSLQLIPMRSEEHTSELQSRGHLVCRLLLETKKQPQQTKPLI